MHVAKKVQTGAFLGIIISTLATAPVFAHVTVKPESVAKNSYQTFTVSVPNEKTVPTTALRLVVPTGVEQVTPTVKDGWTITANESSDNTRTSEIIWSGNEIPENRRDEFSFSAKTPNDGDKITWKAYQTYQDGSVVAWDAENSSDDNHSDEALNPASVTELTAVSTDDGHGHGSSETGAPAMTGVVAIILSTLALFLAIIALLRGPKKA